MTDVTKEELKQIVTRVVKGRLQREDLPPRLYPTKLDEALSYVDLLVGGQDAPKVEIMAGNVSVVEAVQSALALYLEGLERGSGGREGMIAALDVIGRLAHSVPELHALCEPLGQLQNAVRWTADGIEHPALKLVRSANRPQDRVRQEYAVRCVVALFACREAGRSDPERDVLQHAKSAARLLFFKKAGALSAETLAGYEDKHSEEAVERLGCSLRLWMLAVDASRADTEDERRRILEFRATIALQCLDPANLLRSIETVAAQSVRVHAFTGS